MGKVNDCLINMACIPCQGGTPPLTTKKTEKLLHELKSGWALNDEGHLYKEYKFTNFMTSMTFANKIAEIAEREGHHPDLNISWALCSVEIWTHKINSLTESDFILAAKIEAVYE